MLRVIGISRLIIGLVAAALTLPLYMFVTGGIHGEMGFVLGMLFSLPATFYAALPIFFLVKRRSPISFRLCLIVGASIGALMGVVFSAVRSGPFPSQYSGQDVASSMFIGILSALVFWFVGIWNNGHLTSTSKPHPSGAGRS